MEVVFRDHPSTEFAVIVGECIPNIISHFLPCDKTLLKEIVRLMLSITASAEDLDYGCDLVLALLEAAVNHKVKIKETVGLLQMLVLCLECEADANTLHPWLKNHTGYLKGAVKNAATSPYLLTPPSPSTPYFPPSHHHH